MARTVTAATIITRARRRSDTDTGAQLQSFPDADLLDEASEGAAELYDLLLAAQGMGYYAKSATLNTIPGDTNNIKIPTDFYRFVGLTVLYNGWVANLDPFVEHDRAQLQSQQLNGATGRPLWYRLIGQAPADVGVADNDGRIEVYPGAITSVNFTLRYVPVCARFATTSSVCWGINGWEEYVVLYVAKRIALKEDNSTLVAQLEGEMQKMAMRVASMAPRRDASASTQVTDVRRTSRLGGGRR